MKLFITTLSVLFSFLSLQSAFAQNQPVKEWTILVYLNADNDLYEYAGMNMAQMEAVGSNSAMNVVVQLDPKPNKMPTSRYYVTRSAAPNAAKITSQVVQTLPETDMGNPKTLTEFLQWGVQNYPAKKYAVVIWNHGNGWQGVSYDDNPRTNLTMTDVRTSLEGMNAAISQQRGMRAGAPQVDLINFDACLMSTLEVAFELKDVAKVLVGSQFNEPGEGEDYRAFLNPLAAKPTMTARELSEVMVYQYSNYHKNGTDINYAAIDLSKVANFTNMFNSAIGLTNGSQSKAKVKAAFGKDSFDLVTGLNSARAAASADVNVAKAYDTMIGAYGYPKEGIERGSAQRSMREVAPGFTVSRFVPSDLFYKTATNGQFQRVSMQKNANGMFEAKLQAKPAQYYVVSAMGQPGREMAAREALSTVIRNTQDSIVFHNQFPETSPMIADSYSLYTRGAHGMTLYSLAGMKSVTNSSTQNFGRDMLSLYKQLLFSRNGAPNWSALFGL